MGTRADFYVGRGETAEWIGSIALDGYPEGIYAGKNCPGEPTDYPVFNATTEADYRRLVDELFKDREDVTRPADGWPWPWEDSCTTDYAYAFDGGTVWAASFGHRWFDPKQEERNDPADERKLCVFPQFSKDRMARPGSTRSGIGVVTLGANGISRFEG